MAGRIPGQVAEQQQGCVPAGDDQGDTPLGQRAVFQDVDGGVAGQVVDP
ncbi:hypothetical protein [Dactylosporangium sp. NPDC051541]